MLVTALDGSALCGSLHKKDLPNDKYGMTLSKSPSEILWNWFETTEIAAMRNSKLCILSEGIQLLKQETGCHFDIRNKKSALLVNNRKGLERPVSITQTPVSNKARSIRLLRAMGEVERLEISDLHKAFIITSTENTERIRPEYLLLVLPRSYKKSIPPHLASETFNIAAKVKDYLHGIQKTEFIRYEKVAEITITILEVPEHGARRYMDFLSSLRFSKTFVIVSHNILTGKLRNCGLDEWRVRWIENWLNDRS
ncbi:hypothetical protein BTVI_45493 [Pitangus sulphuratus]|nr:hypothetical protein BTVI_45493 [Pitangus sulphuratus]